MTDKKKIVSSKQTKKKIEFHSPEKVDYLKYPVFVQDEYEDFKINLNNIFELVEDVRISLNASEVSGKSITKIFNEEIQQKLSNVEKLYLEQLTKCHEERILLLKLKEENKFLRETLKDIKASDVMPSNEVSRLDYLDSSGDKLMYSLDVWKDDKKEELVIDLIKNEMKTDKISFGIHDVVTYEDPRNEEKVTSFKSLNKLELERMSSWICTKSKWENDLTITEVKLRTYKLLLMGVDPDCLNEEIEFTIRNLCEFGKPDHYIPEVFILNRFKNRDGMENVVIKVDYNSMTELLKRKKICIGFVRVRVTKYIDIIRCFRCQSFGHYSYRCKKDIKCGNCGKNHVSGECKSKVKYCVNCKSCEHGAFNKTCPEFIKYKQDLFAKRD